MVSLVDPATVNLLTLALDATAMRQHAIAQNIANVNTPGYQRLGVGFESRMEELKAAAARGAGKAGLAEFRPVFELAPDEAVTLETEMVALSENTLHHQALLKALNKQMALMSVAINEGKR
ncbi:flagellar basal body rod protein FlgB [Pseudoduganella namucuonensis]|uniref:Flagellar basal body rod protein FlgB n=1 Tax=Pseudoduganella namucuonensis TaxID=1035707 RepID=A0A1I7M4C1_9BURK|nr:flagellar basal body protein [Pseudoduganella namucuonensis]SFV16660.1 flagellar basal-body rod protein FlgB [Pseudoduganella namucuonensis]